VEIMIAYDDSRNAKLALAQTVTLFRELNPLIILICVAEEPRDASDENEALFRGEYAELKAGAERAAAVALEEGISVEVIMAEGDPRKMILRATKERAPDLLVVSRRSNEPDGGLVARSLSALVDEIDYMTFGSVSSFLARRVECPLLILPSR
jgi:nucleotide-binding universal stress UspA family protein